MPQTKTQRSAAARRGAETRRRHALDMKEREGPHVVDRTTELSDDVLKSLESGQRAAIEAVRKFVDVVDEALPVIGEQPSRREHIIDAAMEWPTDSFTRSTTSCAKSSQRRQDADHARRGQEVERFRPPRRESRRGGEIGDQWCPHRGARLR